MKLIPYPDRDLLMIDLADKLASELGDFTRREGRASFCVPGGSTPGPVFDYLSAADLDWADITVFLNDERWVPEDSSRSNTTQLKARLMQNHAAAAQFVPFYTGDTTPQQGAAKVTQALAPHLPISVLLLGMGADMHTASLFPGAAELAAGLSAHAPNALAVTPPGALEPRLTLSGPVLQAALNIHILIVGNDKKAALERAQELPSEQAPIAAVLENATVHWAE
jgi:6-phosphogluconolactonase